jgi:hypothetical protein
MRRREFLGVLETGGMRRRNFLRLLGGSLATWPRSGNAQQAETTRRIGVLMETSANDAEAQSLLRITRQRLEELGWTEGKNIRLEDRWAAGNR